MVKASDLGSDASVHEGSNPFDITTVFFSSYFLFCKMKRKRCGINKELMYSYDCIGVGGKVGGSKFVELSRESPEYMSWSSK